MKPFSHIAGFLFGVIALLQLLRVVQGWEVIVNGFAVPLWASAVVALVTAVLAVMVWREARR